MSEVQNVETAKPVVDLSAVVIKEQKVPQKLKVTDLTTGADDAEITNSYVKYSAPEYDPKKHGADKGAFIAHLLSLATALVQPVDSQVDALLYRATQMSYQAGKDAAFASGSPNQYLSPELKSTITMVVKQSSSKYADASNGDAFNSWKAAFTSQSSFGGSTFTEEQVAKRKAGADKVLQTAQALSDSGADAF